MIYILISLFFIVFAISLFEERLQKYKSVLYISLCVILVLCAAFKPVGFDNDSEQYEYFFYNNDNPYVLIGVEYSYVVLSRFFMHFTDDVHIMFLLYGGCGLLMKMSAIKRLSELWFLPIMVYLGNYYVLHELTQIRACVVSGLFMLAIIPLAEGNRKKAFWILVIGCIFHYSTLVLFPALFLTNKEMTPKWRIIWALVVPIGYLIYFLKINPLTTLPIPYIGDKLAAYQELSEKGQKGSIVNVFNAVFVVIWFSYLYILYFYDTVIKHNKYLPLMLRLTGISIFMFLVLTFLPVLSFRVSELYGIVEIFIFANIYYTINPKWLGKTVVLIIGLAQFCINAFYANFLHP